MNHNEAQIPQSRNSSSENCSAKGDNLTLVQFLYMEFFGAFVPGVAAVGAVWAIMFHAAKNYGLVDMEFMKSMLELGLRPYGFVLLLFLAYSVGAIVYRRPHDEPDAASCFRIVCRSHRQHTSCDKVAFHYDGKRPKTATARLLRPALIRIINEWMWSLRTGRSKDDSFRAELRHFADQAEKSPLPSGKETRAKSFSRRRGCWKMILSSFGAAFRWVMEHWDFFFRPERAWYWKRERSKSVSKNSATYRMDCTYPYPFYRRYLYKRDAGHLAKYVTWCAGSPEAAKRDPKGKLFINALKQRIRALASPELIRDMVRNEAHVRTLSSLWFILRFLALFIVAINLLFAVAGTLATWKHYATTALLLGLVLYLKYIIETGFHYVRLRELNMVLETADILQTKMSCSGGTAPFSDYLERGRNICPESRNKSANAGRRYCEECSSCPESGGNMGPDRP